MRTFFGVVVGFCLTSVLILLGEWGFTMVFSPGVQLAHSPFSLILSLASLVFIGLAVAAGGYLTALIDDSPEAIGGFSVLQLFFGVWFFREFWTTGFSWYRPIALFLIIPCAMAGRHWSRRRSKSSFVANPPGAIAR
jgi:hypothetical protein